MSRQQKQELVILLQIGFPSLAGCIFVGLFFISAIALFLSVASLSVTFKNNGSCKLPVYFKLISTLAILVMLISGGYATMSAMNYHLQVAGGYPLLSINTHIGLSWLYIIGLVVLAIEAFTLPVAMFYSKEITTNPRFFKPIFMLAIVLMLIGGTVAISNLILII